MIAPETIPIRLIIACTVVNVLVVTDLWLKKPLDLSWLHQVKPHVFGHLPGGQRQPVKNAADMPSTNQSQG
jgi:xanthosine utilization system XapX-like protein